MAERNTLGLVAFGKAITSRLFTAMSGPLSVPAAIAAYWIENQTAKILLGVTAFVCVWAAAYGVWRIEREGSSSLEKKLNDRNVEKQKLLDEIADHRIEIINLRIEIDKDRASKTVTEAAWQQRLQAIENKVVPKIENFSSSAEAKAFKARGNIKRPISPMGGYQNSVVYDTCVHDIDYLQTFIHDYSRLKDRG